MASDPTFVFEGDKVYAMQDGKVLAAADDLDELEEKLDDEESAEDKKKSSRIVTPSGVKGTILGRTPDLWGLDETLTVRLANGRIAHYKVADVVEDTDKPEFVNPINRLQQVIEEDVPADLDSLGERQEALASLKREAHALFSSGLSEEDQNKLDTIIVTADAELSQIDDRLDYINDEAIQRFEPFAPATEMPVVEQGGRPDGAGWLDTTLEDMATEADQYDYQKFMDEGPEAFVAEQETDVLADQGATQFAAAAAVREKTAGTDPEVREKYEKTWLSRVEDLRREELSTRKETTKKEAAAEKDAHDDAPDESLFL
jgi:hypothetical protein